MAHGHEKDRSDLGKYNFIPKKQLVDRDDNRTPDSAKIFTEGNINRLLNRLSMSTIASLDDRKPLLSLQDTPNRSICFCDILSRRACAPISHQCEYFEGRAIIPWVMLTEIKRKARTCDSEKCGRLRARDASVTRMGYNSFLRY